MDPGPDDVAGWIASREGKHVEFKRGLPRDEKVARTLCAFANTRGGILLVGVGDRGELVGAPRPRETTQALRAIAAAELEPPLAVQAGVVMLERRRIVWCSVPLSPARPHSVASAVPRKGGRAVLVRVGSSNRVASGATLAALRARNPSGGGLDELERRVLRWVEERTRGGRTPSSDATVAAFAAAHNVGRQRARRAFTDLERAGRLVAHGLGSRRVYGLHTA
jgi:hypothetical protein